MKTGSGAQDIYCPRLWYYKYLTFLDAKDQSQRSGQDSLGDEAGTSGNVSIVNNTQSYVIFFFIVVQPTSYALEMKLHLHY